jgi:hypothetical protein
VVSVVIVIVEIDVADCSIPGAGVSRTVDVYTVSVVVDEGIAVGITFEVAIEAGNVTVVVEEGVVSDAVTVDCLVSWTVIVVGVGCCPTMKRREVIVGTPLTSG